jgi:hypothetical protein
MPSAFHTSSYILWAVKDDNNKLSDTSMREKTKMAFLRAFNFIKKV